MLARPLYKIRGEFDTLPIAANAGLWHDKFCHQWANIPNRPPAAKWGIVEPTSNDKTGGKLRWIQTVTKSPIGETTCFDTACLRLEALASAIGGEVRAFTTFWHFVTGLGRSHPIGNGFAWHPTLGTPYLPGSSVKGLLKAWAREQTAEAGADSPSKADVERIFGSDGSDSKGIGSVLFFDAIPCSSVTLTADIMTPHYGPYYADTTGKTAPGDWHDPNPIPFLAVAPGQTFLFALAASRHDYREDYEQCFLWLEQALTWLGAGAKTAVGYGRFRRDENMEKKLRARRFEAQKKAKDDARLATLSAAGQEFEEAAIVGKWDENKDAFAQQGVIETWIDKLAASPEPDVLSRLGELIEMHFPGLLANPERTEGKKNKPSFKPRQREFAKRFNSLRGPTA